MMSEPVQISRERIASDFQRPIYHFLPPSNWMNDPNGFIQWQGQYHLFYQYNPFGAVWGNMHWGHATSRDLIHWQDHPIALAPTPGGPDEAGCFSGCAVDVDGTPMLFYTGARGERHDTQTQCRAISRDGLMTWEKDLRNPILHRVPDLSGQQADFRDPFVWKQGDAWYMVVGSRVEDVGGAVFLYRSDDLVTWTYLHPLLIGDRERTGLVWECPNFFPLDDHRWVLIVSAHTGSATGTVFYFVGDYVDHQFTPAVQGVLDHASLYAPLTTLDDAGRRLLIGWIREERPDSALTAAGWAGAQSIPRVLSLDSGSRLLMTPVSELGAIRGRHSRLAARPLDGEATLEVSGRALDLDAEFVPERDGTCGISVVCSMDGGERTDVFYDAAQETLTVRTVIDGAAPTVRVVPHALDAGEHLRLRLLLDGSVLEIIANQRTSLTHRVYSGDAAHQGVRVVGRQARLNALDIWEMPSIWR
ncbi:MAG: glycoside hydrolase family 32 protein [Anaerolineae bacterium]|nr:glycoside hydrolase family 32 protein [Anaerolineae bacterium]